MCLEARPPRHGGRRGHGRAHVRGNRLGVPRRRARARARSGRRRGRLLQLLGAHHEGTGHVLRQHGQEDVPEPEDVALLQGRAIDLLAVEKHAVGAAGVADGEAMRAGLHYRVSARALDVVEDEVARRIAAHDGDGALELDLVA